MNIDASRKQIVQEMLDTAKDSRLTWRIVVDAHEGTIRITKELSSWIKAKEDPDTWHRLLWKRIPLRYEVCHQVGDETRTSDYPNEYVNVKGDRIHFNGGYLQVYDNGTLVDVADWEMNFDVVVEDLIADINSQLVPRRVYHSSNQLVQSVVRSGNFVANPLLASEEEPINELRYYNQPSENIRLEADIEIIHESELAAFYPIFYFPQESLIDPPNNVILGEYVQGRDRVALWRISEATEYLSKLFRLDGPHLLVVNQDRNRLLTDPPPTEFPIDEDSNPYFEMMVHPYNVNSIFTYEPPRVPLEPPPPHYFGTGWRKFYIGYAPGDIHHLEPVEQIISKHGVAPFNNLVAAKNKPFVGYVRRIVFDPNTLCGGCKGRP